MGRKSRSFWPFGLFTTALVSTAALLLRGCWHRKLSWPVRVHDHSYQVCLGCGIKRLFDEKAFRGYGPYHYDIAHLIAWDSARTTNSSRNADVAEVATRPASAEIIDIKSEPRAS